MNKSIHLAIAIVLSFVSIASRAQEKSQAYYNSHETEILPDAQTAFRNADYERAAELCQWHYVIVGDSRADALGEKARRCAKLTDEMNGFLSKGQYDSLHEKAKAILALNPNDRKAKEMSVYDPTRGVIKGHEWVDLDLPSGTLWATQNVGANKPEDYGDYFAWGETSGYKSGKTKFNLDTYKWLAGRNSEGVEQLKKYVVKYYGEPDNKAILDKEDDAAFVNWGSGWLMPTKEQFEELLQNCTWKWTTIKGIKGFEVKGKNGNTIFLPSAGEVTSYSGEWIGVGGEAFYWSRSLNFHMDLTAWHLHLRNMNRIISEIMHENREFGLSIRPVCEEKAKRNHNPTNGEINGHEWVDLGLSVKWATCNVGASSPSENGDYFAWGETSTKSEYTWQNYKFRLKGNKNKNVVLSKYNTQSIHGAIDGKTHLDLSDDAAHANWGDSWRMPTHDEFRELQNKCLWRWTTRDGKIGYQVTGPNGNSIFLPAAGVREKASLSGNGSCGAYWESDLYSGSPYEGQYAYFDEKESDGPFILWFSGRYYGFTVRPVTE